MPGIARRFIVVPLAAGLAVLALNPLAGRADSTTPSFSAVYVSKSIGGGEPFVMYSHATGNLVYSGHEGTTHIDRTYTTTPGSACDIQTQSGFLCSYDNHVNDWYSIDGGQTWQRSIDNPLNTGFSDPSLTEDAAGNVYNTGIDLANDALFMSTDGGKTFVAGTPQCSQGDRPWLAGGKAGEVFLGTDLEFGTHTVYKGFVESAGGQPVGIVCSSSGIADSAAAADTSIGSPMAYDTQSGSLIEPARVTDSAGHHHIGISVLANASAAFGSDPSATPTGSFVTRAANSFSTTYFDLIEDTAALTPSNPAGDDTVYVVWATQNRSATEMNGCGSYSPVSGGSLGRPSMLPNSIMMAWTKDQGKTWSNPVTLAHPGTTVIWPWITVGAPGNVSVVWYQSNQLTDPDCDSAALLGHAPSQWTLQAANIFNATSPGTIYPAPAVNAIPNFDNNHPGGVFHTGTVCQSGTTCAATGQDRRLGDYFTNTLDKNGCVMIATADTQLLDPVTGTGYSTGRPLFVHQTGGTSLTTGLPCGAPSANTPEAPWLPALIATGGAAAAMAMLGRRRLRLTG